jgi:hypothetical protein
MSQNKSLGEELKSRLDCITSRFDVLSDEISDLYPKFAALETRVCNLESTTSTPHPSTYISDIIQEFSEVVNVNSI